MPQPDRAPAGRRQVADGADQVPFKAVEDRCGRFRLSAASSLVDLSPQTVEHRLATLLFLFEEP